MAVIKWSPFRRIIEIVVGIYVESGFLSLNSTAKCAEATFFPPTLNFFSKISAYIALSLTPLEGHGQIDVANTEIDTPFYGEVLTNGAPSKTCGGNQLATTVTDACGTTYASATADYGPQSMWLRKVTQRYVPSSLYSGKLRLFVQAIYGSTRADYEVALGITGLPETINYKLQIDGYTLEHHFPTAGLFTDSNYNYYLIEATVSQFKFYPLILTTAAQQWRDVLKTHANRTDKFFAARVESYILAYATIDLANPVIKSTGASVAGMPVGFGFKFNWAGTQAKCILHELDMSSGINTSRTLTIDIDDALNVTASVVGGSSWSNGPASQFWSPDYFNYYLVTFGKSTGGLLTQGSVPMYGYYVDDVWQEFTVSSSTATTTYNDAYVRINQSNLAGFGYDPPVNADQTLRTGSNVVNNSIGYSFGGETVLIPIRSAHTQKWYKGAYIVNNGSAGFTSPITNTTGWPEPQTTRQHGHIGAYLISTYPLVAGSNQWGWYYDVNAHAYKTTVTAPTLPSPYGPWRAIVYGIGPTNIVYNDCGTYTGLTEGGSITLAVPLNDCESIIYGHNKYSAWTAKQTNIYFSESALNGGPQSKIEVWDGTSPQSTNKWKVSEEILDNQQVLYGGSVQNSGSRNIVNSGANASGITQLKYHNSGISGWTHDDVDGVIIKEETTSSQSLPAWAEKYFLPGDISGDFHPVVIGRSSAGGASIMYHVENANGYNANGYPPGVYSAIGFS